MASFAWITMLFALLGHAISAIAFSSGMPDADLALPLDISPVAFPVDMDVNETQSSSLLTIEARNDHQPDPGDFRWIHRWAAIGDSFTAGIGAGNLYSKDKEDWRCSRYDRSYPARLELAFGGGPSFFQYLACSGDRTEQIYEQVQKMEGDMDFVVLTAGGNDLCLADLVKSCVLLPQRNDEGCENALRIAEDNMHHLLKANVKQILEELDSKMHKNGLVLYVLYAQFFNVDTEQCGRDQNWNLLPLIPGMNSLPLTRERRQRFNDLVDGTNAVLRDAIKEVKRAKKIKYRIRTVDWDDWARFGVRGQFCEPGTIGLYPDKGQPELQFFKPNTSRGGKYKRLEQRDSVSDVPNISFENTVLYKSPNPAAIAKRRLDSRAPLPPGCPSDNLPEEDGDEKEGEDNKDELRRSWGLGLPDSIGRFFHPNELGHTTIASYALQEIYNARAEDLGIFNPSCALYDRFECHKHGDELYEHYAAVDRVVAAMNRFCVNGHEKGYDPDNVFAFHDQVFYERTPDETRFEVQINKTTGNLAFDPDQCLDSFKRIIHGCDGNDEENPLNFKYGGRWVRGAYTYKLSMGGRDIKRDKVVPKKVAGKCTWKKTSRGIEYEVFGTGFSNWDFGMYTLLSEATKCAGGDENLVKWSWQYYPWPLNGWEWVAWYTVPSKSKKNCHLVPTWSAGDEIFCKKK